jgi:hypothetical protein
MDPLIMTSDRDNAAGKRLLTSEQLIEQVRALIETYNMKSIRQGIALLNAMDSNDVFKTLVDEYYSIRLRTDGTADLDMKAWEESSGYEFDWVIGRAVAMHLLRGAGRLEGAEELSVDSAFALEALIGLEKLRTLSLKYGLQAKDMGALSMFPSLSTLFIADVDIQDLKTLPDLPNLQQLHLRRSKSLISLDGIERYPELFHLELHSCDALTDIGALRGHPSLRVLNVRGCASITEWDRLADVPWLSELEVSLMSDWTDADCLGGLNQLEHLKIKFCRNITNLEALRKLPNLKTLDVRGCKGVGGVEDLARMTAAKVELLSGADAFFDDFHHRGPLFRLWEDHGRVEPTQRNGEARLLNLVALPNILAEETSQVYPFFSEYIDASDDDYRHRSDFMLIDGNAGEIRSFGLGRKNRIFHIPDIRGDTTWSGDPSLQHYFHMRSVLEWLGEIWFERDHQPPLDAVEYALRSGPSESGVYEFEFHDSMNEDELNDLRDYLVDTEKHLDRISRDVRSIFPHLDIEDLNTWDY